MLNALDRDMISLISASLVEWRCSSAVDAVVVESTSPRAFCAGGDVRAVRSAVLAGDTFEVESFFSQEYELNATVAEYPKPIIALIDGICMGGGIGLAVHAQVRVATEAALLAMPETAIGMFPDIGATYFLPRLAGQLGMFLGLTGTRLPGADSVHAGIATHFVPRAHLAALRAALVDRGITCLGAFTAALPAFTLAPHLDAIDRCFAADSVLEIVARLDAERNEWAGEVAALLRGLSPSALSWSFAAMRRGARLSLREALRAELRLTQQVTVHNDFSEGIRAMVVDKDRRPRWSPPSLEAVNQAVIAAMLG